MTGMEREITTSGIFPRGLEYNQRLFYTEFPNLVRSKFNISQSNEDCFVGLFLRWFSNPQLTDKTEKRNFINVQIDAVGIGITSAVSQFLAVFLTLLGASNFQVGMLTSMPALTGFLLAIPVGNFLQGRRRIVPWFSAARLSVIACYVITGLVTMTVPADWRVTAVLIIWAVATLPQTVLSITFSVVMNAVAGPTGRFELMSRRWAILGFTTAIAALAVGQILDAMQFPINYQVVFMATAVGGLISYYFSSRIVIPDKTAAAMDRPRFSFIQQYREYLHIIATEKPFISFVVKRTVFLTGTTLALPLFPIYFVREVQLSNSWIAGITTAQTAVMVIGYFYWTRQSRARGSRPVLIWTTMALALYPIFVALTSEPWVIVVLAGLVGVFQAGLDLVFFDELMNTIPPEFSATFVSFAQSLQYFSSIISPLLGTFLADQFGVSTALIVAGAVRLAGSLLFLVGTPAKKPSAA